MPEKKLDTHFEVVIRFKDETVAKVATNVINDLPFYEQESVDLREVAN